jgi:hypothetical protein
VCVCAIAALFVLKFARVRIPNTKPPQYIKGQVSAEDLKQAARDPAHWRGRVSDKVTDDKHFLLESNGNKWWCGIERWSVRAFVHFLLIELTFCCVLLCFAVLCFVVVCCGMMCRDLRLV